MHFIDHNVQRSHRRRMRCIFCTPPLDCEHYLTLPSCIDSNLRSSQESDVVVDDNDAAESLHNIGKIPVSPFHPTRSGYSEHFLETPASS